MLQSSFLLNRSGIMETVSLFAAFTFNFVLFLSSLNVANSEEGDYHSIASVRSIVDVLPVISVFIFVVVGIVLCGFCSKSKSNDTSSREENLNSSDYDTLCLGDCTVQNGCAREADVVPDCRQDADIYDCVNETTAASLRSLEECKQEDSGADDDVTVDETLMVYNIAYLSADSDKSVHVDDSDIYDHVTPNGGEGASNIDAERRRPKSTKKTVGKSLSEPIHSTLLPRSYNGKISEQDVDTENEAVHRRQTAPAAIESGTKKKVGKAMTLQFGGRLHHSPLDSLPEEDYDVVDWTRERSGDGSSGNKAIPDVKERSSTLRPITRRQTDSDALLFELSKVQKMRKEVAYKKGSTLPPLGNLSENIRDVEDKSNVDDDKLSQTIADETMTVTCHSNDDDVASLPSASSRSEQSDSESFDADSFSTTDDYPDLQGNEQSDIVAIDTLESAEVCDDSDQKETKHTYVNVDVNTDFHCEVLQDDDDTATYGNLGANRDILQVTSDTGLSLSQEPATALDNVVHTLDSDQTYATFRYEDAKVDIQRRSSQLKKATLIKEEDEDDEYDDIFYPDEERTEEKCNASHTVQEQEESGQSVGYHDNPSQRRPHKIFTNESFLKIEAAIAMQQALNNSPAEKIPAFCRRWRVQRFSL